MVAERQWLGGESGVGDRRTPGRIARPGYETAYEDYVAESSVKADVSNEDVCDLVDVPGIFLEDVQDLVKRPEVDDVNNRVNGVLEQLKIVTSQVTVLAAVLDANRRVDGLRHERHDSVDVVKAELLAKMVEQSKMTGGSSLLGGVGPALERAVMNSGKVPEAGRTSASFFLSGTSSDDGIFAPQSGEIVGMLKQLKDETTAELNALEKEDDHKTVEVPQVQYVDEIIDVPVMAQRRVPTSQTAQKTEEVPQVQFFDRVVDVLVELVPVPQTTEEIMEVIQSMPQERTRERSVEETDVFIPRVTEEVLEVAGHGPRDCAELHTGETR